MSYADLLAHFYGGHGRDEHPDYPVSDWKYHVTEDSTRRGYWDWVASEIEAGV